LDHQEFDGPRITSGYTTNCFGDNLSKLIKEGKSLNTGTQKLVIKKSELTREKTFYQPQVFKRNSPLK